TAKVVLKVTLIDGFFLFVLQVILLLKLLIRSGNYGEFSLRKLFSTFPSEWPGVGLLLLRALVGCSLIVQGIGYVRTPNDSLVARGLAVLAFASGAFLLAGLMTPLVAVLVAAGAIGIALSRLPLPGEVVFDDYLAIINLIVLSIAIALLGPGAFSLDARMFGRREITIPVSRNVSRP
ncbi:MAG TPA: DoxX family protein, partial [Pyrinomonadaceae bacterium]|nr:DoxX family protein [Pyrinomonadaceae bacterium]